MHACMERNVLRYLHTKQFLLCLRHSQGQEGQARDPGMIAKAVSDRQTEPHLWLIEIAEELFVKLRCSAVPKHVQPLPREI